MVGAEDKRESIGKGMASPDLGIGNTHAAEVGGHHQFVVFVRMLFQKNLTAEFK